MLEIINIKTFKTPENHEIRVITDTDGNTWFVAEDVTQAMGYKRTRDALWRIADQYRELVQLPQLGRESRLHTVLDVHGVYAFAGNRIQLKRQCRQFLGWFTQMVLPYVLDRLDDSWWHGLRVGIQALTSNLNSEYGKKYRTLVSKYYEATVRAEEAENRLKAIAEIVQGDRS